MRYEDLKIHIAEVERRWRHPQTKSVPQVLFPENLWENETLQLKPGDCQRGSTTNNIDILTLDVCLLPRILISFAMISHNKLFQNFTRIPGLSSPISTRNFLQGHMEVDRNGKMSSGRTYNWHSICLRWSDLLMQDHTFLRHFMEQQLLTINWWWLSIIKYLLIIILMNLSASNEVSMIIQGTVEEWNSKFPHFKTLLSLTCIHTNALKFYSLLLNLVKITIQYGNYKEIPTWKGNYGEFTYVLRYLTKYSWWKHLPPSASIILHSWFK